MKRKGFFAIWNKKGQSWIVNPPKELRKKIIYPCPHCGYHKKKKKRKIRLRRNHKFGGIRFVITFSIDHKLLELKDWICVHCGNELNFENFPEDTKNFVNNLFIRDLKIHYLTPSLLILKTKAGKEFGGKALKTGATYKTDQKSIMFICGNCKNKNRFQIIKTKNRDTFQCMHCGKINILQSELFKNQNIESK